MVLKKQRDNLLTILLLGILLIIGFFYRLYGLDANHAFWTDEDHVAIFTRAILERGKPVLTNGYSTGSYQWLQYWLSAISVKIFGLSEFAIRFPSVIFGVLTIWAIYLLGKELFNRNVGLAAAILTAFLKIEILWSRQARPYQALQFFYLLGAWFIYKLIKGKKFNWRYLLGFLASGILTSLMHGLGLTIFLIGFLCLLIFRFSWFKNWAIVGVILLPLIIIVYSLRLQIISTFFRPGRFNNFFYYRVFLWHNYSLLIFLALIGFLFQIFQKKDSGKIIILFLIVQTIIASFFLGKPFARYFYIVFPFLVLLSAGGLVEVSRLTFKKQQWLVLVILLLLIIGFGNKFTLFPQKVYSLNEDMQEIPEVDYKKIYAFIEEKLEENPDAVYVSNWNDHPIWYLGEGELDYLLRIRTKPPYDRDSFSGAEFVKNLEEFNSMVEENSKGIVLLESWDDQVPEDARRFIRQNLNKELEVDRLYPTQPRYWPVEIYSWRIEE